MVVRTIAVIGAGALGRRLMLAALLAGYRVVLEDVSRQSLDQSLEWIRSEIEHSSVSGKTEAAPADEVLSLLTPATKIEDAIRDADLIIETVPDELEMKLELFTIFDKFAKPDAIFASTTSALAVGDVTDVVIFRERCIGMRFKSDSKGGEALEIVKTTLTSEQTVAACYEVASRIATAVVITNEMSGSAGGM
jgi:3-hydroxyacyl-CoA dehydrogenase